jgi:hypothetical protein
MNNALERASKGAKLSVQQHRWLLLVEAFFRQPLNALQLRI